MRHILSIVLAVALAGSPSLAADGLTLAPGKPAGTREANLNTANVVLLAGAAGFAVGFVLILMHAHGSVQGVSSTTTATAG